MLEDSDGVVVGRDDRPILNDRHLAPPEWGEADRPLGVALVKPDPATPPGTYTLKLAVYDPATLAQLPASGHGAAGSFVTLGQVQLTSATEPADPEQLPIEAHIESTWQGVRLLGRGALPAEVSPGDRLAFDLYWQAPSRRIGGPARSQDPADVGAGRVLRFRPALPCLRRRPRCVAIHRRVGTLARSCAAGRTGSSIPRCRRATTG